MPNKEFILSTVIQVLDKATGPLQKIGKGFGAASLSLDRTADKLNKVSERTKKLGSSFSGAGRELTTGITIPILGAGIAALKTFGDFEMLTANFTTMFQGNEKAAKGFLAEIEKFANATPYTTAGLAKNAQTMMSFGMSSEQTMKVLKQLGDIAGGNEEKMNSLSLAFAQVSSAGKLQGQDLLQMINAGFNPLQVISKKTGKSMADLKGIMEKGGISAAAVGKAFELATQKGGLFYQGADRGSKTLNGLFSSLKDEGEKSLRLLGETLKDSLNLSEEIPKLTKRISEMTKSLSEWIKRNPELTKFLIKFLLIAATVGPVLMIFGKVASTVSVLTKGFGLAAKGISGFLKVFALLKNVQVGVSLTKAIESFTKLSGSLGMLGKALGGLGVAITIFEVLDSVLESIQKKLSPEWFESIGQFLSILTNALPVLNAFGLGWQTRAGKQAESRKGAGDQKQKLLDEINKRANDVIKNSKDPEQIKKAREILNASKTEITVKVEAEPGSSASIDKIKSKGNTKPKISNQGYLGNIYLFGQ